MASLPALEHRSSVLRFVEQRQQATLRNPSIELEGTSESNGGRDSRLLNTA